MKNHSIPLKASASMSKNAKALIMQSKMKTAALNEEAYRNVKNSNNKWSNFPTAPYLTPFAEGLTSTQ